jgi:uncharacterized membrane protein
MRMRIPALVLAGSVVVAASLAAAVPSEAAAPAPQYKLVLGPVNSQYNGIDSHGDIIGIGVDSAAEGREEGFLIKAGTTTLVFLGAPGDETDQHTDTTPRSINAQGVIIGNYGKNEVLADGEEETVTRPATWPDDGTGSDLGVNSAGTADAFGINDNSQIVGTQAGTTVTPWSLQGSTVTNLPTFSGATTTEALAVSSKGVVAGDAGESNGDQVAAEWVSGKLSSLGTLNGGTWGEALAINTAGQVVGAATAPGNPINLSSAVMFSNGKAIDLKVPGEGQGGALATAINTSGVIVGEDGIDPDLLSFGNGFIYRNGQATELNTLIAPTRNVRLAAASGINDSGDIVGIADVTQKGGTQVSEGYELVPITS